MHLACFCVTGSSFSPFFLFPPKSRPFFKRNDPKAKEGSQDMIGVEFLNIESGFIFSVLCLSFFLSFGIHNVERGRCTRKCSKAKRLKVKHVVPNEQLKDMSQIIEFISVETNGPSWFNVWKEKKDCQETERNSNAFRKSERGAT